MMQLKCKMCGSDLDELFTDEFVCLSCGYQYSIETYTGANEDNSAVFKYTTKVENGETVSVLMKASKINSNTVTIPIFDPKGNMVVEIGDEAFQQCSILKEISIPLTVTKIGKKAFFQCNNLADITLGNSVTHIDEDAFAYCGRITNITFPESLQSIGPSAFRGSGLTSIVIPGSVNSIGANAFYGTALKSVTINDGVVRIEEGAFASSQTIHIDENIAAPPEVAVIVTNYEFDPIQVKNRIMNVIIPNSVTSIGKRAFYRTGLTNITIPNSVIDIGEEAFCSTALQSITIPSSVKSIGDWAFAYCHDMTLATINAREVRLGRFVFADSGIYDNEKHSRKTPIVFNGTPAEWEKIQPYNDSYQATCTQRGRKTSKQSGCYVATCVYGSYDCPQVWTLRRFRDDTLGATWYGRAFIRTYYAISPTLVKWFGKTTWFKHMWQGTLDLMVAKLNSAGVANTPYRDKDWS